MPKGMLRQVSPPIITKFWQDRWIVRLISLYLCEIPKLLKPVRKDPHASKACEMAVFIFFCIMKYHYLL
jgi:hypothetical protein